MEFYKSAISHHVKSFELPIGIYVADPQIDTPYHSHEYCEIALVTSGTGRQRIYGRSPLEATVQDVFILPSGTVHGYFEGPSFAVVNIIFMPEKIFIPELDLSSSVAFRYLSKIDSTPAGRRGQFLYLHLNETEYAQIIHLTTEMEIIKKNPQPGYGYMLYCLLLELLGRLCLCQYLQERRPPRYHYIDKAIETINKTHGSPVRLESLAQKVGMSGRNMRRQFKKATGATPSKYLMEQRIRKAAEMLHSSDLSIGEIATSCDFCDGSYFTLQFRRLMGITPSAYRKQR